MPRSQITIRYQTPDIYPEPEPRSALDAVCNWLVMHPRWAAALIVASIWLAFWLERHMP